MFVAKTYPDFTAQVAGMVMRLTLNSKHCRKVNTHYVLRISASEDLFMKVKQTKNYIKLELYSPSKILNTQDAFFRKHCTVHLDQTPCSGITREINLNTESLLKEVETVIIKMIRDNAPSQLRLPDDGLARIRVDRLIH
jgi:hypothetical protein